MSSRWISLLALVAASCGGGLYNPQQAQQNAYDQARQAAAAAQAATFDRSDAERDQFIVQWTEGYEPMGEPIHRSLDAFETVPVSFERGQCYAAVIKLEEGAAFSEHARTGVSFQYQRDDGVQVNAGPGVHGRGGVATAGCPLANGEARFDIQAIFGSATDTSKIHDLGTGPITIQLMTKTVTEEELAAIEADMQRQIEEQRAFAEAEAKKKAEGCAFCKEAFSLCTASGHDRDFCEDRADQCVRDRRAANFWQEC